MENKKENLKEKDNFDEEKIVEVNNIEEDKKTILVVDDEKPIVDILTYNLQKEGYNTLEIIYKMLHKKGIEIKLITTIYNIVYNGENPDVLAKFLITKK